MTDQTSKKRDSGSSSNDMEAKRDVNDSIFIQGSGNTVTISEGKKPAKNKTEPRKRKKRPPVGAITTALIAAALIILILLIASRSPSPLPQPPAATNTITPTPTFAPTRTETPVESTATMFATDTPAPSPSPAPPPANGEDWEEGCISVLWEPYPETVQPLEQADGCWKNPVFVFSAENGRLRFLSERGKGPTETYGLFALLPDHGTATITVRLDELSNADLLMGVFAEPDPASNGLLLTILNGDVSRRAIVQKDPPTYETLQGTVAFDQGYGYSLSFTFDTISVTGRVNPNIFSTNPYPLPSGQKWLFLGYKGLGGSYRIEGQFLDLELK